MEKLENQINIMKNQINDLTNNKIKLINEHTLEVDRYNNKYELILENFTK